MRGSSVLEFRPSRVVMVIKVATITGLALAALVAYGRTEWLPWLLLVAGSAVAVLRLIYIHLTSRIVVGDSCLTCYFGVPVRARPIDLLTHQRTIHPTLGGVIPDTATFVFVTDDEPITLRDISQSELLEHVIQRGQRTLRRERMLWFAG